MEGIFGAWLPVAAFIVVMLVVQKVAKAKGLLVKKFYSIKQRIGVGIMVAFFPILTGVTHNDIIFIVLGVCLGVISFLRKFWYGFR